MLFRSSIVGMLMYHNKAPVILQSAGSGIYQHNAFNWQLEGTRFLRSSSLSPAAEHFSESMNTWLEQMSLSERQVFIDDLFSVLDASGAATISEFQAQGIRNMTGRSLRRLLIRQLRNTCKPISF